MFGLLDIPKMVGAAVITAVLTYAIVAPMQYAKGDAAGRRAVVQEVTKQNFAAGETARKAKDKIDACYDAGGSWSQETGSCAH